MRGLFTMSYNLLDIANSALIKVGAKPLQSLDDDTPSGRVVSLRLRPVMDTVVTMYPFTCSRARTTIGPQPLPDVPSRFANTFQLPSDLLKLLTIEDNHGAQIFRYDHSGGKIHADPVSIVIYYSRSLYTLGFADFDAAEAISLYLAYDICERVDENSNRRQQLYQEFLNFYSMVRTSDARKGGPSSYGPLDVFGESLEDPYRPNQIIDSRVR